MLRKCEISEFMKFDEENWKKTQYVRKVIFDSMSNYFMNTIRSKSCQLGYTFDDGDENDCLFIYKFFYFIFFSAHDRTDSSCLRQQGTPKDTALQFPSFESNLEV